MLIVVGRPVYALMLDKTSQEVYNKFLSFCLLASCPKERVIRVETSGERRDCDLHYLEHLSNTAYIVVTDVR